jgi:hypothetical protein
VTYIEKGIGEDAADQQGDGSYYDSGRQALEQK